MAPRKKNKTAKNFEFLGLGFPVVFPSVELQWIADEWLPNINMRKVMDAAFEALIEHPAWLTGAQVAFVRKYMGLTQEAFARGLGLTTHVQVSRWEKRGQEVAGLSPAHEANLRVLMRGFLGLKTLTVQDHIRLLSGALMKPKGPIRLKAA